MGILLGFPPPPPLFDEEKQRPVLATFSLGRHEPPGSEQSRLCSPGFRTCFYFLGPTLRCSGASSQGQLALCPAVTDTGGALGVARAGGCSLLATLRMLPARNCLGAGRVAV